MLSLRNCVHLANTQTLGGDVGLVVLERPRCMLGAMCLERPVILCL